MNLFIPIRWCTGNLCSQKLLEFFEKFKFSWFWAPFHRPWYIYCTVRFAIFYRCARYVFASVLMNTPAIANGTIALDALIATIRRTLGNIPRLCTILLGLNNAVNQSIKILSVIISMQWNWKEVFDFGHTFCSSKAAARSVWQSDSVSASRSTGSASTIVFDRSTVQFEID